MSLGMLRRRADLTPIGDSKPSDEATEWWADVDGLLLLVLYALDGPKLYPKCSLLRAGE